MNTAALSARPGAAAPPRRALLPSSASDWRTHAAVVLGLQVAHLLFESVRTDHALHIDGPLDWLLFKGDELLRQSVNVVTAVAALRFIESLPARHPHRTPAAVLAMAVAGLSGALVSALLFPYEPLAVRVGASASTAVWFWYTLWMNAMVALLALVAIDGLRGRQQAAARLAEVQEQGRLVRQRLASAQLLAIQARVDPQLLFDMLAAVKRGYEHDVERAESLLDELTAFLRAALPRLRSPRSTLEVEFGLVERYVILLRSAGGAPIALQVALPPACAGLAFPPGVLLPLLAAPAADARRIALAARVRGAALRVRIIDSCAPAEATLERLRGSLRDLYGDAGALRRRRRGRWAVTELELPLGHD